ncbi:MAG: PIG-L family deacetylase [Anaerolineales bacterium]|nr:PIG-L family deacetylase [Anaerolineales bacterium]
MPEDNPVLTDSSIPERAVGKVDTYKEPPAPASVLTIHAHPDDQEFTIAGTLAKWARAGCAITVVCVTSGDAGSNDPAKEAADKPALATLREEEQLAAGREIGVKDTVFLRYPDGELQHTLALRRDLTRLIRKHKPEAVMCGDPTARFYGNSYMNHPDHRAAADAACDAVFPSAGTRLIFTELLKEGYPPHSVKRLYMHGSEKPDVWIDTAETIEVKIRALRRHRSQVGEGKELDRMMREWAEEEGKPRGLKSAEAFRVMVLD